MLGAASCGMLVVAQLLLLLLTVTAELVPSLPGTPVAIAQESVAQSRHSDQLLRKLRPVRQKQRSS